MGEPARYAASTAYQAPVATTAYAAPAAYANTTYAAPAQYMEPAMSYGAVSYGQQAMSYAQPAAASYATTYAAPSQVSYTTGGVIGAAPVSYGREYVTAPRGYSGSSGG